MRTPVATCFEPHVPPGQVLNLVEDAKSVGGRGGLSGGQSVMVRGQTPATLITDLGHGFECYW